MRIDRECMHFMFGKSIPLDLSFKIFSSEMEMVTDGLDGSIMPMEEKKQIGWINFAYEIDFKKIQHDKNLWIQNILAFGNFHPGFFELAENNETPRFPAKFLQSFC